MSTKKNSLYILSAALVVFIISALAVAFYFGGGENSSAEENRDMIAFQNTKPLPNKGGAPELVGIREWINSEPLSLADLRGKVVLIDFWTYSCINCIRTLPHLSEWYQKYKDSGFVLIGVHSQEFTFEKKRENILAAVEKYNLEYPIAVDSEHATWNAYGNRYWPAHYLIDAEGNIRYTSFGEGRYGETENAIQQLLLEANLLTIDKVANVTEPPPDVPYQSIGTPEIYLGYTRINNIGNAAEDVKPDQSYTFPEPNEIAENRFYFVGTWTIGAEASEASDNASIRIRFKANKANVVLAPPENSSGTVEVKLDGKYLTEQNRGDDTEIKDGISSLRVDSPQLYNVIDTDEIYVWHTLELRFQTPGTEIFTFTFG